MTIDVEAYCVNCNSDQHTELNPSKHPHMRWCSLCWDWQKELPREIRRLVLIGLEHDKQPCS